MRLIHCTQKLLKELKVTPIDLASYIPDSGGLGDWYANLVRMDKRKCILFTNERTLYSFLIPGVVKSNLMNIKNEFLTHLIFNLQNDGFGIDVISTVRQEYAEIGFARTANKAVLGSMNDFTFQYEYLIMVRAEGLANSNIPEFNKLVNESPMSYLKYDSPIKVLKTLIGRSN